MLMAEHRCQMEKTHIFMRVPSWTARVGAMIKIAGAAFVVPVMNINNSVRHRIIVDEDDIRGRALTAQHIIDHSELAARAERGRDSRQGSSTRSTRRIRATRVSSTI